MLEVGLGLGVSTKAQDSPSPARTHPEVGRNREEKKEENTFSEDLRSARLCFGWLVCITL